MQHLVGDIFSQDDIAKRVQPRGVKICETGIQPTGPQYRNSDGECRRGCPYLCISAETVCSGCHLRESFVSYTHIEDNTGVQRAEASVSHQSGHFCSAHTPWRHTALSPARNFLTETIQLCFLCICINCTITRTRFTGSASMPCIRLCTRRRFTTTWRSCRSVSAGPFDV